MTLRINLRLPAPLALATLLACGGSGGEPRSISSSTDHLFVSVPYWNFQIRVYRLSPDADPVPIFAFPNETSSYLAMSPTGLAVASGSGGNQRENSLVFMAPYSSTSAPVAKLGASSGYGRGAFAPSGAYFIRTSGPWLNVFVPPFTGIAEPARKIATGNQAGGMIDFDSGGNLYLADDESLSVFPAEGSVGATVQIRTPASPGKLVVGGGHLFKAGGDGHSVLVYKLPLTTASEPLAVLRPTSPVIDYRIESLAVDSSGQLYVGHSYKFITVFKAPFTSTSTHSRLIDLGPTSLTDLAVGK